MTLNTWLRSGLTLTFEHVTWKSIGIIYSLRATPATSLVLIKWQGQMILSGQHCGLRRVVWPWPLIMLPENPLIEGNPWTKFGIDQEILSRQHLVYRPTDHQPTDWRTVAKQYAPFFKGGIKTPTYPMLKFYVIGNTHIFFLALLCWNVSLLSCMVNKSCCSYKYKL